MTSTRTTEDDRTHTFADIGCTVARAEDGRGLVRPIGDAGLQVETPRAIPAEVWDTFVSDTVGALRDLSALDGGTTGRELVAAFALASLHV